MRSDLQVLQSEWELPWVKGERWLNGGQRISTEEWVRAFKHLGVVGVMLLCLWGASALVAENRQYELERQEQVR